MTNAEPINATPCQTARFGAAEVAGKDDRVPNRASCVLSRRSALGVGAAVAAAPFFAPLAADGATSAQVRPLPIAPDQTLTVTGTINGRPVAVEIDARTSLLDSRRRQQISLCDTTRSVNR